MDIELNTETVAAAVGAQEHLAPRLIQMRDGEAFAEIRATEGYGPRVVFAGSFDTVVELSRQARELLREALLLIDDGGDLDVRIDAHLALWPDDPTVTEDGP